jgi:hypothetical protein
VRRRTRLLSLLRPERSCRARGSGWCSKAKLLLTRQCGLIGHRYCGHMRHMAMLPRGARWQGSQTHEGGIKGEFKWSQVK